MSAGLNENHIRVLKSGFDEMENALNKFLELLKANSCKRSDSSGLYDITESIESAGNALKSARKKLGISKRKETDPVWAIRAGAARLWEMLEDMKPDNIKGYGEISQDLKPVLNDLINKLLDSVEKISKAAEEAAKGSNNKIL